jgi:hypothetical protein
MKLSWIITVQVRLQVFITTCRQLSATTEYLNNKKKSKKVRIPPLEIEHRVVLLLETRQKKEEF